MLMGLPPGRLGQVEVFCILPLVVQRDGPTEGHSFPQIRTRVTLVITLQLIILALNVTKSPDPGRKPVHTRENGFMFLNSGNVGIGTTAPGSILDITDDPNAVLTLNHTGAAGGYTSAIYFKSSGVTTWEQRADGTGNMSFSEDGAKSSGAALNFLTFLVDRVKSQKVKSGTKVASKEVTGHEH